LLSFFLSFSLPLMPSFLPSFSAPPSSLPSFLPSSPSSVPAPSLLSFFPLSFLPPFFRLGHDWEPLSSFIYFLTIAVYLKSPMQLVCRVVPLHFASFIIHLSITITRCVFPWM
jgi:hypothetical protein